MKALVSAIIELLRPLNCCMAAIAVCIGAVVEKGDLIMNSAFPVPLALAVITTFIIVGAGNILNDYFDREIDKINHPQRPIPSGRVREKNALALSIGLFCMLPPLAWLINIYAFAVLLIAMAFIIIYEMNFKRRGFIGNITISVLVALLFIYGALAVSAPPLSSTGLRVSAPQFEIGAVGILAALAFLATLGREIVKDIEDIAGDSPRATLPMKIGTNRAGYAAASAFICAIALSIIPYYPLGCFSFTYILPIAVANVIFIYSIFILFYNPSRAAKTVKIAMLCALMAFLTGALL
jgi:geranylgeranylglycerol-phosphate geranylgeranyltransferase